MTIPLWLQPTTTRRVLAAALLLPTLAGTLALLSYGDREQNTAKIAAAIVNLDRPVQTESGGQPTTVFAGRVLAADLLHDSGSASSPSGTPSLGWQLTNAADAKSGLANGNYAAVVTIPADFSKTLSGIAGSSPDAGVIRISTADPAAPIASEIAQVLVAHAVNDLGTRITTTYLDGVRSSTQALQGNLNQAATGADKLSSGAGDVSGGAQNLADGSGQLASGSGQLAQGAHTLADATSGFASGSTQLASGANQLASGLTALTASTKNLPSQTQALADGAAQVAAGADGYARLVAAWETACIDPVLALSHAQLCQATAQAAGPGGAQANQFSSGAHQVAGSASALAGSTPQLASAIARASGAANQLDTGANQLEGAALQISGGASTLASGADATHKGTVDLAAGAGRLSGGAGQVSSGASSLSSNLREGAQKVIVPSTDSASVVASPVRSTVDVARAVNGRSLLAPIALALALWLGAFVIYLVRPALPHRHLAAARTAGRLVWMSLRSGLALSAGQTILLFGAALLLGAHFVHPVGTLLLALLAGSTFVAAHQAMVATFGRRRGWLLSVGFAILQVVSLGGWLPADTAPQFFKIVNGLLPIPIAVDGLSALAVNAHGVSVGLKVLGLLTWAIISVALSVSAASRKQTTSIPALRAALEDAIGSPEPIGT